MLEFIVVALATFTMVLFVMGLLPFRPPVRLMPVLVSAAGYGCMRLYGRWPHEIEAAAVAGGVAIVFRYAVAELPEPWNLDDLIARVLEFKGPPRWYRKASRVPQELPGRRVPRL